MRPDVIEEEYLEDQKRRIISKPLNVGPRPADKSVDRMSIRPDTDRVFKRSTDFQPNNSDFSLVSADEEWVCERCGAEIPPAGRFCAACGYATGYSKGPRLFSDLGPRLKGWFSGINELGAKHGFTPASQIALAIAAFCLGGAIIVQLSLPAPTPWISQVELHQAYALRTLLWMMGSIIALMVAIVFKRQPRIF